MTSDSTNLGLIVGIAVGVAALVAVACLVLCLVRTRLSCGRKCKGRRTGALPPVTYNKPNEEGLSEETGKDHVVRVDRLRSLKSSQPRSVRADFDKMKMPSDDMAFSNDMAIEDEEEVESRVKKAKERRSKTLSVRPGLVKKLITTEGGVTKIADISLDVGPGCLENDTEITLIRDDQNFAFQSLLKLGLVDDTPRVVEFLPDGLKFLKPALLKIKCEKSDPESELFVLHGSYNPDYQRTVWELVTNDLEENSIDGVVSMKINGFCFYSYILARRGKIARILSHLNHSFTCRAYSFYRRASVDSMDISVVIVSEFVDKKAQERIDQLQTHQEEGYTKGEKGKLKRVHTDRGLEMSLNFPGLISSPFPFKIDQPQLDSVGFVVEQFKVTPITSPANGTVDIKELHRNAANKLLWNLNIREMEKEIKKEAEVLLHNTPEPGPPKVC
ncbi:uncharacterized protein LOC114534589 [Dendronephthya gigantea]|uniref:uncharacterized protein LOC114534589 n=1 Tax=Dendronephthya gigantea TaxID=151771 RepID=UPI00106CB52F|nr:uncharacterized protein LOC114534589 [Dendronephthya gigantea]